MTDEKPDMDDPVVRAKFAEFDAMLEEEFIRQRKKRRKEQAKVFFPTSCRPYFRLVLQRFIDPHRLSVSLSGPESYELLF